MATLIYGFITAFSWMEVGEIKYPTTKELLGPPITLTTDVYAASNFSNRACYLYLQKLWGTI